MTSASVKLSIVSGVGSARRPSGVEARDSAVVDDPEIQRSLGLLGASALVIGLLDDWLSKAVATCGKAEASSLRTTTRRLQSGLGGERLSALNADLIVVHLKAELDAGYSRSYVEKELRAFRRALEYGRERGLIRDNPARGVTMPAGSPKTAVVARSPGKDNSEAGRTSRRPNCVSRSAQCHCCPSPAASTQAPNATLGCHWPQPKTSSGLPVQPGLRNSARAVTSGWHYFRLGEPWDTDAHTDAERS